MLFDRIEIAAVALKFPHDIAMLYNLLAKTQSRLASRLLY